MNYAQCGEQVTCEAGHLILVLDHDLPKTRSARQFDQPEIKNLAWCPDCGAPYAKWFGTEVRFHFPQGWRL